MYWWFFLILFTVTSMCVSIKDLQGLPLKLLISCIAKLQFLKLYDQLYAGNFSRNCLSYQWKILRIDRQVWRWPRLLIYVKNTASACWAQKVNPYKTKRVQNHKTSSMTTIFKSQKASLNSCKSKVIEILLSIVEVTTVWSFKIRICKTK